MSQGTRVTNVSSMAERLLGFENETENERRHKTRIQARESAAISRIEARSTCAAIITDVSTRGMSLTAKEQFLVGSTVIVEWGRGFVPCTVRHCGASDAGWTIGVEAENLPGIAPLLSELVQSAQQRNRSRLLPATICA
jgi:hypothetical protein